VVKLKRKESQDEHGEVCFCKCKIWDVLDIQLNIRYINAKQRIFPVFSVNPGYKECLSSSTTIL
jgi:hypothetical protein